ncbi:hypothetical protein T459_22147 [Capsicum annuum]|uniref:DNA/RNA-binding protein Alba-like domain-containing protein n=1 Tax=Capsicum annuum TaxID=4072 RepID=A0A2G2YYN2_CAPAN|nr:hypothetical protein T459_22147 [Capsicum annuum]
MKRESRLGLQLFPLLASPSTSSEFCTDHSVTCSSTRKQITIFHAQAGVYDTSELQRYMQQHNEVELSALGMAITTVVTVAEILKNGGFATEKKVLTSTVGMKDEAKGRMVQKARIEIVLTKSEKFDKLMTPNNNNNSERAAAQDGAATNKNTNTNDTKEQTKK